MPTDHQVAGSAAQRPAPLPRTRVLLEGPIVPTLARLSAPNIMVAVTQSLVAIADAWYVGMLGVAPLAALALVFPVQSLMSMMSAGAMGGGISSATARALGAGDRARAEAIALHALIIAAGMAVLFTIVFVGFGRSLYGLLGGRGEALEGAVAYSHIMFGAAVVVWLANTLASLLRGTGNMAVPGITFTATALLGILLSGALTLGWAGLPRLGVVGPAVAFILSFLVAGLVMLAYLVSGRGGLRLRITGVPLQSAIFVDILKVGLVACGNALLTIATIIIVTGLVGRYGTAALAGYGLGSRLEIMLIAISFGVGGAMVAMVGANRGARNYERARQVAWTGGLVVLGVTEAIGLVVAIWPDLWIGMFTADAAAAETARVYLRIAGPCFGGFGLGQSLYFATQGTGIMRVPFIAGVARLMVAAAGGALAAITLGAPLPWLFALVAVGLLVFGGIQGWAIHWGRTWNPGR